MVTTDTALFRNIFLRFEQASPKVIPVSSPTLNITIITPLNASLSGQPVVTWEASAECTTQPTLYNSVADLRGRRWGIVGEGSAVSPQGPADSSCAYKDAAGAPVFSWETAPRCLATPSVLTATSDDQGRLWGSQFGLSCAFKAADSDRPLYDFLTAPACASAPEPVTSEADASGRLWGWELGRECAFKLADNTPLRLSSGSANMSDVEAASPTEMVARGAVPTAASISWRASPRCTAAPSKFNSVMDSRGRLWGFELNASCAFKDDGSVPVFDWVTAPRCLGDIEAEDSRVDASGRLWGFEAGSACAFKDMQQQPLRLWTTAPRCSAAPTLDTAVPDESGRLWGWVSNISCAYRDDNGGAVTFPPSAAGDAASQAPTATAPSQSPLNSSTRRSDANRRAALAGMRGSRTSASLRGAAAAAASLPEAPAGMQSATGARAHQQHHRGNVMRTPRGDTKVAARPHAQQQQQQHHHNRRMLDDFASSYPSCKNWPAPANAQPDYYGRYWSAEGGSSCVYRDGSGKAATLWDIVPACSPAATMQSTDGQGRLWGWENSRSCAFKGSSTGGTAGITVTAAATVAPSGTPAAASSTASASSSAAPSNYATGDIHTAPSCSGSPTMDTSQPDDVGYLWGWQDGRACVFRGSDSNVLYYAALITGDWSAQPGYVPKATSKSGWFDAPRCSNPPTWDAKPDSEGRLWGYESGHGCVFRDARGYPLFYSDLQSGNVAEYYNKGSLWDNAPRCPDSPSWSTARADNYGRLWGFDTGAQATCAYKDVAGQPIYPPKM
ncbi:hypothetical protein PLESTF_000656500 [Pleodorina starrii]|nr:hypothetical protein PLESTM_001781100 [Pleodorina starrii]GLC68174.1 hypothetical protein PLESTF_000656500 [Pleodorina starrii]